MQSHGGVGSPVFSLSFSFLDSHVNIPSSCFWSILVLALRPGWTCVTDRIGDKGNQVFEDLRPKRVEIIFR